MKNLNIRRAGPIDAKSIAELLNAIIEKGGTTAYINQVTGADLHGKMALHNAVWHLAEDDAGQIMGFQWIAPNDDLPNDITDIATFARIGATGLGIGSSLFEATKVAAVNLGYAFINATIRADNSGGLAYYQSRGFEYFARKENVPLTSDYSVDRIQMRYKL